MNLIIPYNRVLYKLTRKKKLSKVKEHMMTTPIDMMTTPIETFVLKALDTIQTGTYYDVIDWLVYQWLNNALTNIVHDDTVIMIMNNMVSKNLIKPTGSMAYGSDGKLHTVYKLTTIGYNQLMSMTDSYDFYSEDDDPYVKNEYDNVPVSI